MDDKRIYIKKHKQGRVVVVDPNKVMDENEVPSPRYVAQEDLVMYAKLTAHSNGETTISQGENGVIEASTNDEVYINFLNPVDDTKGKPTTANTLSTRWTDLFDSKEAYRSESFGIESVNIEYNASYVPTVTINFVDLRGKTLFERGDDPTNPYNIFFQFPYPQFTLTVKGYYGRTVNLPLILEKTNTNFDGQTGDYKTVATFRSFTFALLNDIPLRYIAQAPYMYPMVISNSGKNTTSYEGMTILVKILEQYSKSPANGGLGVDLCEFNNTEKNVTARRSIQNFNNISDYLSKILNLEKDQTQISNYRTINAAAAEYHKKYPITIPDFVFRLSKLESEIADSKAIARRLAEYDEILKTYETLQGFEREFLNGLRTYKPDLSFERNGYDFYFPIEYEENDAKKTELLDYISSYIDVNIISKISKFNIGQHNYYKELKDATLSSALKTNLTFGVSDNKTYAIINPTAFLEKISKQFLEPLGKIQFKASTRLESKILDAAKMRLGFAPTFKNVLILVLANFETFLTLLYQKSLLARKQIDDDTEAFNQNGTDRKRGPYKSSTNSVEQYDRRADGSLIIYPWPDFFKSDGKSSNHTDRWYPGELAFFKNREEIKFIDELIDSVVRMQEDLGNRGGSDELVDSRPQISYTPITPDDIPVLFTTGDGLTLNSEGNKLYNPEDKKTNVAPFKFGANAKTADTYTAPTISSANILVKAIESAIFLGISSSNPNGVNADTIKFENIASQIGEAHGNNLFNSYGSRSPELLTIHKLFTKSGSDLNMNFFNEFFVNTRKEDDVEKGKEVSSIKSLINDGYQTMWRNVSIFTEFDNRKETLEQVSSTLKGTDKLYWGRSGIAPSFFQMYNSNINTFTPIALNENYTRPNGNDNSEGFNSKGIADLLLTGDQINGNHDYFLSKQLIVKSKISTSGTTYSNIKNETLFNKDNSATIRKLYIGLQDMDGAEDAGSEGDRQKYLKRFHLQTVESEDNNMISLNSYRSSFYRNSVAYEAIDIDEDFDPDEESGVDDFLDFDDTDSDIRVTPSDISGTSSIITGSIISDLNDDAFVSIKSILDTISFYEGTSDVTNKTQPSYFKNDGYDICLSSMKPSKSGGKIVAVKHGNDTRNVLVGWTADGNTSHPNKTFGGKSTAIGRYQFLGKYWNNHIDDETKKEIDGFTKQVFGIKNGPLTKYNQDAVALWLIFGSSTTKQLTTDGAITNYNGSQKVSLFKGGNISELFASVASVWASIPNHYGQSKITLNDMVNKYNEILTFNKANNKTCDAKIKEFIITKLIKDIDISTTTTTTTTNNTNRGKCNDITQVNGSSVWYHKYDSNANQQIVADSKLLAQAISKSMTVFPKNQGVMSESLGVLKMFNGPGALVEVGYINNLDDLKLLKTKQAEIGKNIADGIINFVKSKNQNLVSIKIVIDPGHGDITNKSSNFDPGALSPYCDKESEFNLAISKQVVKQLIANGCIYTLMTRTSELNQNMGDYLKWRSDYANKLGANYLIAIHCNSAAS